MIQMDPRKSVGVGTLVSKRGKNSSYLSSLQANGLSTHELQKRTTTKKQNLSTKVGTLKSNPE